MFTHFPWLKYVDPQTLLPYDSTPCSFIRCWTPPRSWFKAFHRMLEPAAGFAPIQPQEHEWGPPLMLGVGRCWGQVVLLLFMELVLCTPALSWCNRNRNIVWTVASRFPLMGTKSHCSKPLEVSKTAFSNMSTTLASRMDEFSDLSPRWLTV